MLLPEARPVIPSDTATKETRMLDSLDHSLTEDYGELGGSKRTLGGGVDFFSSLGTERKKKPKEEKPNPEKVRNSSSRLARNLIDFPSYKSVPRN